MRTTVTLAPDVSAAVEHLRKERAIGLSAAVNELIRAGLSSASQPQTFRQRTVPAELTLDVTNVAEALEILEGNDRP